MSRLKQALMATPLYPLARAIKRSVRPAEVKAGERRLRDFYRQFFEPGETVFDVGGLMGEYAEAFAKGGARVITVEPNPAYRLRLTALARQYSITPAFVAAGEAEGTATLSVCSTPGYSSLLSPKSEWMQGSPDYDAVAWTHTVEVPVSTLDALAARFGQPAFVKIDVEGFELNVLRGMSFSPRYLSFEFGARRKDLGLACLKEMGRRGYTFRPMFGRDLEFALPEWISYEEAADWLSGVSPEVAEYGDMFARAPAA